MFDKNFFPIRRQKLKIGCLEFSYGALPHKREASYRTSKEKIFLRCKAILV